MTEEIPEIGCDNCTGENPVWETIYRTDNGYLVNVCDCGRAKIDTQSVTKDVELWEHDVRRDEKGRFKGFGE